MPSKNNSKKKEKINFIIGLGRSGFWSAKFLRSIGKKVIVLESKENKELLEKKEVLEKLDISVYLKKNFYLMSSRIVLNKLKLLL